MNFPAPGTTTAAPRPAEAAPPAVRTVPGHPAPGRPNGAGPEPGPDIGPDVGPGIAPDIGPDVGPHVGRVSWYCEHRGFGFLETMAGDQVFMSFRDLPGPGFRRVRPGQQVSFTLDHDVHGPVARTVFLLEASRAA